MHGAIDQPGVVDALRALAQGHECTLFMVVLAAVKALLYRYSRQTDLIVGSPVSGRRHGDLEDQIGYYVNVLPLRTVLDGNWSFGRLLREVQATVVDAYDHQDYPFYRLVDDLDLAGDPSRSPVFDVMVAFEDLETGRRLTDLPGLTVSPCVPREVTAKFDLVFTLRELPHALAVTVEYSQDLFDASYATRLLGHLQTLFAAIAPGGPAALDALPYLPAAEAEALLTGFNAAPDLGQRLAHPSIETLLVEQVRATPDAPALQSGRASMSYRELGERVDQLAAGLAGHGIGPGHVVGVMIGRSFEMMIAILGIIRAGAAYLPIDPDYPAERVRFLLEHSRTRYVLVGPESAGPLPGGTATPLEVNALLAGSACSAPPTLPAYGADRLLYVLYTSGSTGQPKGVMVTMHAFVNLLDWYVNELGIGPGDRNLLIAPTSFDLAQKNLFAPLVTGGTLHLLRPGPYDYAGIADTIESAGITTINCAPAAFYPILEENAGTQFRKLRSLRSVVLGGEPINLPKFLPWMEAPSGGAVLFNSYGPTECTDVVSAYRVQPADYRTLTSVPIGKPLPRVKLYVLDEGLQPLPVGHPGELYIGGVALSRGYFNNPALTREKFPETPHLPCPRLYRTGDLVKWLPDGNIAFLGRRDFQVKVRGYRIEPAEVKEALLRCPGLHEACVVPLDEAGEKVLAGYYTGERRVSPATLRTFLKKRLPAYMVPAYLVRVKAFPLTPNGKVDFNALPKPADVRTPASAAAPRSPLETTLLALWREVLGREGVGINDNFFDAGGHSLKATRLVLRIHQELHVRLEVKDVFARPTVARLARLITGRTPEAYRAIEPVAPQAHYPLSRAQRRLWLVHQFEQVQGAYHIGGAYEFDGPIDGQALAHTFDALVRRHEILRTVFVTVGGEPRQVVQAPGAGDPILACLDLDGQPGGEALVAALARREADTPFDLERGPLLRARLVRLGDRKSVLLFTMHHLIADGWSVQVLVQEVLALYKTFRRGGNPGLAPLRVQYKDYAAWQAAFLAQPGLHKHRRYWLGQLAGPLPVLPLPTDYPRPPVKTYPGALLRADLDDGVSRALYRWSRRQGTTLFVTLFAATNALLYGLTGADDIVVGLPLAGRNHPDLEGQIGFYVNTLPIRTRMRADTPFKGLVRQVKTQLLRADKHQAYPLDGLPADLNLARDVSRSPLFDVLIESVNRNGDGESITALDGIAGRACPVEVTTSKFDLAFRFSEEAGRVTVALEYNTDLFGQSTIQSFRQRLDALLREVAAKPAARLGDLCPPPGAEVPGNAYEAAEVDALFSNIF